MASNLKIVRHDEDISFDSHTVYVKIEVDGFKDIFRCFFKSDYDNNMYKTLKEAIKFRDKLYGNQSV